MSDEARRYCLGPTGMTPADETPCPDWDYDDQWVRAADFDRIVQGLEERLKNSVPIRFYNADIHDVGEVMICTHNGEYCRRTDLEAIKQERDALRERVGELEK